MKLPPLISSKCKHENESAVKYLSITFIEIMSEQLCRIWHTPATVAEGGNIWQPIYRVYSPRAGGAYEFHAPTPNESLDYLGDVDKSLLRRIMIDRRDGGIKSPSIGHNIKEFVTSLKPKSIQQRSDRLLKYIKKNSPHIGDHFKIHTNLDADLNDINWIRYAESLAFSESFKPTQLYYLLNALKSDSLILFDNDSCSDLYCCSITREGDDHLHQLTGKSKQNKV